MQYYMRLIKYSKMGNLALYSLYCPWWFSDPIMMSDEGNTSSTYSSNLSTQLSGLYYVVQSTYTTNIDHCFLMLCQHQIEKVLEGKEGRGKYIYQCLFRKKIDIFAPNLKKKLRYNRYQTIEPGLSDEVSPLFFLPDSTSVQWYPIHFQMVGIAVFANIYQHRNYYSRCSSLNVSPGVFAFHLVETNIGCRKMYKCNSRLMPTQQFNKENC